MNGRRGRGRGPLDFSNPVDLIVALTVDWLVWQLRRAGRQVILGVVLLSGVVAAGAAFLVPLLLVGLLIAVFGLAVEPYKWIGSILIAVAFVVGIVAAVLTLRQIIYRSRRVIALLFDDDDPFASSASPIVPPTREQWNARIRAMDDQLASTTEPSKPGS